MTGFMAAQGTKLRRLTDAVQSGEVGQDMIEYALLAALISIAAILIVLLIGPFISDVFTDVVNGFGQA